jgi:hypothetical protein
MGNYFKSKSKLARAMCIAAFCSFAAAGVTGAVSFSKLISGGRTLDTVLILLVIGAGLMVAGFAQHSAASRRCGNEVPDNILESKNKWIRLFHIIAIGLIAAAFITNSVADESAYIWIPILLLVMSAVLVIFSSARYSKELGRKSYSWVMPIVIIALKFILII